MTEERISPLRARMIEDMRSAARRVLTQDVLGERGQTRDPLAHVGGPAGQVDPNARSRSDHAASTARINRVSTSPSMPLSNLRRRPLLSRSSTGPDRDGADALAGA